MEEVLYGNKSKVVIDIVFDINLNILKELASIVCVCLFVFSELRNVSLIVCRWYEICIIIN